MSKRLIRDANDTPIKPGDTVLDAGCPERGAHEFQTATTDGRVVLSKPGPDGGCIVVDPKTTVLWRRGSKDVEPPTDLLGIPIRTSPAVPEGEVRIVGAKQEVTDDAQGIRADA